jgi:hypothetical protein
MITELILSMRTPVPGGGRAGKRRTPGQTMAEFALVLPALLLLIFGIIEFARIFYSWLIITNAVRTGERYAVTGDYMDKYCTMAVNDDVLVPGNDGDDDYCEKIVDSSDTAHARGQDAARAAEEDYARLMSIVEVTNNAAQGLLRGTEAGTPLVPTTLSFKQAGYFHIVICSTSKGIGFNGMGPGSDCECTPRDDAGNPMEGMVRVLVALTFEHPLIMPLISSIWPHITLHAERSGLLEQFRVARVLGVAPVGMAWNTHTSTPMTPSLTPTITNTHTIS